MQVRDIRTLTNGIITLNSVRYGRMTFKSGSKDLVKYDNLKVLSLNARANNLEVNCE